MPRHYWSLVVGVVLFLMSLGLVAALVVCRENPVTMVCFSLGACLFSFASAIAFVAATFACGKDK